MTSVLEGLRFPAEFQEKLDQIGHAFLINHSSGAQFTCFRAQNSSYRKDEDYNFYQIPCLIRLIGKKLNLFTNDLLIQLQNEAKEVAVVFHWEETFKVVLIINTQKTNPNDMVSFLNKEKDSIAKTLLALKQPGQGTHNKRHTDRYKVWPLGATTEFPIGETNQFRVYDISLNGIQIWSYSRITLTHYHQVKLNIKGKEPLPLNLKQVWQVPVATPKTPFHFKSGYHIKFFNYEDFKRWLSLLYAFDKIQSKNQL